MVQMACLLQPRDGRSRSGAEELMENGGARWTYGMRNLQRNQPVQPTATLRHAFDAPESVLRPAVPFERKADAESRNTGRGDPPAGSFPRADLFW